MMILEHCYMAIEKMIKSIYPHSASDCKLERKRSDHCYENNGMFVGEILTYDDWDTCHGVTHDEN